MSRRIIGPFNRVEGDLEVTLEIADGAVTEAWVNSPLYRGFEQILHGKAPEDALVYTPRICGICSVSQSVAAARALAEIQGVTMPPNGRLATNLVLANENLADHLTHFYLFFMPDFAREVYAGESWYAATAERFRARSGGAAREALPARAAFLNLMGLLAGKWPHSLALQPGGTTRAVEPQERIRILALLADFRRFLESVLFADSLARISEIESMEGLRAWMEEGPADRGDLRRFLHLSDALGLDKLGRAGDRFMSYGAYAREQGRHWRPGLWTPEGETALDAECITEDVSHSWMEGQAEPKHPWQGVTLPGDGEASTERYSWCKAPRLDGRVVEVGAFARQVVDGHPLARDLVAESGANVRNRVVGRLLELARLVPEMERWARALTPGEAFCDHAPLPDEARGVGLVEAARGSLGHWVQIRNGRILNYQIVAPTTWNFSPRDRDAVPGALEQALVGAPVRDGERDPVAVQHIVRSFDPCMVCTVH